MFFTNVSLWFLAALGPIYLNLQKLANPEHVEVLKAQACRDVLILLGYVPSYKGVLKKKQRKKQGEGGEEARPPERPQKRKSQQQEQRQGQPKKPKRSFRHWFDLDDKVHEARIPGFNIPLQAVTPEFTERMVSWRGIPQPNIRDDQLAAPTGNLPMLNKRKDRK